MMKVKSAPASPSLFSHIYATVLKGVLLAVFYAQAFGQKVKDNLNGIYAGVVVFLMGVFGSAAFAQMTDGGNQKPDEILNKAVCGTNGWLTWFTSTKFLVVILAGGLVAYFIGKAVGKRDNDGILGAFIAVCGLGAIRILVKIVTTC